MFLRKGANAVLEALTEKTFSVVFEDHPIHGRHQLRHEFHGAVCHLRDGAAVFFAVHAHNLLLPRNDSRFDDGRDLSGRHQRAGLDSLVAKKPPELRRKRILPDHAAKENTGTKRAEIPCHIRGPSRIGRLSLHLHDRHRGLGGDAGDAAPDKLVQHDVANNQHASRRRILK